MTTTITAHQTLLGFDYGRKRIGVAVGQGVTRSATALTTVRALDGKPDWPAISHLIEEWEPDALVVGIPYHIDGTEQEMTHAAQRFCRQLEGRYRLPVYPADERLTSYIAKSKLPGNSYSQQDVDPLAARLILQDWLHQKEPKQ